MRADTPKPEHGPSAAGRWILGGLLILNLVLGVLALWSLHQSRTRQEARTQVSARNLVRILERNLAGELRLVDTLLQDLRMDLIQLEHPHQEEMCRVMERHHALLPDLVGFRMAGPTGHLVASTGLEAVEPSPAPIADRPYFQEVMGLHSDRLVVSSPVRSRLTERWVVILARPVRKESRGPWTGILFAVVDLERLTQALGQVDVGFQGLVTLRDENLALLTRRSVGEEVHIPIGDADVSPDYRAILARGSRSGTFHAERDGVGRTWVVKQVGDFPLWVGVGLGDQAQLAAWRNERLQVVLALLGIAVLSGFLGVALQRAWKRQHALAEDLHQEKSRFQTLTEQTEDVIWAINPEGTYSYVSPAVLSQRGYTPEEMLAMAPGATFAEPQGGEAFKSEILALLSSPQTPGRVDSRVMELPQRRKDGSTFPTEIQVTLVRDPQGRPIAVRGITRDITERKAVQQERERLIQDLTTALAEVKALKGMLPICSACKKIRDDQGYWNQIETYLSRHTEATFTHGLCPDCIRTHFPEMFPPPGDPQP